MIVAGITAFLLKKVEIAMAVWVLVSYGAYLRPSTNMGLRRGCLIRPVAGVGKFWTLVLHPSASDQRSKQGIRYDTV
eukprot:13832332-Heterocapsa_arctica.AAC.1